MVPVYIAGEVYQLKEVKDILLASDPIHKVGVSETIRGKEIEFYESPDLSQMCPGKKLCL